MPTFPCAHRRWPSACSSPNISISCGVLLQRVKSWSWHHFRWAMVLLYMPSNPAACTDSSSAQFRSGTCSVWAKPYTWAMPTVASPANVEPLGLSTAKGTEGLQLPLSTPVTSVWAAALPVPLLARTCAPHVEKCETGHGSTVSSCAGARGGRWLLLPALATPQQWWAHSRQGRARALSCTPPAPSGWSSYNSCPDGGFLWVVTETG